ncbi:MAG: hypothetical protein H6581_05145 [Bacteroidia bacterium]|nr:hypothetical protein [Bacteroidia bacterium]
MTAKKTASLREFSFHIELGKGLNLSEVIVRIYGCREDGILLINEVQVFEKEFTLKLPVSDFKYFYAVTQVIKFVGKTGTDIPAEKNNRLLSVFDRDSRQVSIGERETVANVFAFSQFLLMDAEGDVILTGTDRKLGLAAGMRNNFISASGELSKVIQSPPNGLETNSYPLFNFLANLLHYCIIDSLIYRKFLRLTSSITPVNSPLKGLLTLARHPFTHPEKIYELIGDESQIFKPSLPKLQLPEGVSPIPNQWTLTIKVNDSGSRNFMIGGPGFLAFDKNDRAWIANNVRQGTPNSGTHCAVLNPDGSPAPFSPVSGGGLLGPGFGVCTDPKKEKIYFGNFGWGPVQYNPQEGSISAFDLRGKPLSPANGHTEKLSRVQGMVCDPAGNLWMCSWGSQEPLAPSNDSLYNFKSAKSAVVVYLEGDPQKAISYEFKTPYSGTFDVVIDAEGNAIVSNGGNSTYHIPSSVYKFKIENNEIVKIASWKSNYVNPKKPKKSKYESFRQVKVNSRGEIFVAATKTNRVIKLDKDLNYLGDFSHNIFTSWGIAIDKSDNIFVANFGPQHKGKKNESPTDLKGNFGVTVIRDEEEETAQVMTLPTGGNEVTLANGHPLYGDEGSPCYQPLMRMTSVVIDAAGNLWAINNWKPSALEDLKENPGGDGIVIFVGVATPED